MLRNISWLTLVSGVERFAAVLQTVLVARVLGITDYGVYGLLFGTIGLAASTAAMQMGLTATVFVSRFRETDKDKAALVISFTNRFGVAVGLLFVLATVPFASALSVRLLGRAGQELAVITACVMVAFSIIGGVQDGIVQGFEDFRTVAGVRLITTGMTLLCVYPAGAVAGLPGVMAIILAGMVLKSTLLTLTQRRHVKRERLPARGSGLSIKEMFLGFSLPSMLASLMTGTIGWLGSVMLSRQTGGFDGLAVVSTGLQWCGPVLLISSTVSTVAIPAISRHYHRLDHAAIQKLLARMLLFNGAFAALVAAVLVAGSHLVLRLYGPAFVGGSLVFSLLVMSSVPQVIAGVYLQHLVAKGRMWQQLVMYLGLAAPLAAGYAMLVPKYRGVGFAGTQFAAWSVFATALALTHAISERRRNAVVRVSVEEAFPSDTSYRAPSTRSAQI